MEGNNEQQGAEVLTGYQTKTSSCRRGSKVTNWPRRGLETSNCGPQEGVQPSNNENTRDDWYRSGKTHNREVTKDHLRVREATTTLKARKSEGINGVKDDKIDEEDTAEEMIVGLGGEFTNRTYDVRW